MEIISMDIRTFDALMARVKTIEEKADMLCKRQEDLGLKKWLDNQEVCDILGISKRTLQEYRAKGLLPFGRIKNKLFYKPEDVEKVLQSYYHANSKKLCAIISSINKTRVWPTFSSVWRIPAGH